MLECFFEESRKFILPAQRGFFRRKDASGMLNKNFTQGYTNIQKAFNRFLDNAWHNDLCYTRTAWMFFSQALHRLDKNLSSFRSRALNFTVVIFVMTIGSYVFFPMMANADIADDQKPMAHTSVELVVASMQNETKSFGTLPVAEVAAVRKTFMIPITAYTSEVGQTDDSPCITASGMNVCKRNQEDIVAANFLPMGTRVRIPELYGERIFTVQDRMNARYDKHMDIWLKDLSQAKQFGLKMAKIEVF